MTPLLQSQLGIFYACQNLEQESENYQLPFLYKLPENIAIEKLVKILEELVKAHPALRSQIVLKDGELALKEIEGGQFVKTIATDDIERHQADFRKAMNLLEEPPCRLEIYQTPKGNYFFFGTNHIINDGESVNIIASDLTALWDGKKIEAESTGDHRPAIIEQKMRSSEQWKEQREWYLKEFAPASDLDSRPVPTAMGFITPENNTVETDFQLDIFEGDVKEICSRFNAGKSATFTAVWGKMLANYTAEDKAAFTTICSGRTDAMKAGRSVTMMVRTLPVFMEMPAGKSVAQWLKEVVAQQKETRAKAAFSFSDISQELPLSSDMLFVYQGKMISKGTCPIRLGNTTIECEDLRTARPNATLDGQLFQDAGANGKYTLRISYKATSYSPPMIAGMAASFAAIFNSLANADTISDLAAVSQGQTEWLDSLNPEKVLEANGAVIDKFKAIVATHPDSDCCVFCGKHFSYKEIDWLSDSLAANIQKILGSTVRYNANDKVKDLPVVSFICPRNELMAILPLSITKAGCTYQPLDPTYPKERLNFMISDARAQLLICTSEFRNLVDQYSGSTLIINETKDINETHEYRKPLVHKDDLFILLYTSGTTGTPKGVMLTQGNIDSFFAYHPPYIGLTDRSRYVSYASYGFDAFMMDLWSCLTSGAVMHIISENIRYDLVAIHDYLVAEKITHAFMTTQIGTQMALNFPEIKALEVLLLGGEKLVSLDPPAYRLLNCYGPTECTIYVSSHHVTKNEKNIPIGHPNPNSRCYVVNKDSRRVPMGASGELWVAGSQVGKGYLNLPEKSSAVFIDNPFTNDASFRTIYRTGDVVRYREDGLLEFVGRKDGQVKIRGFRIELKEIEAVIRSFSRIKDVTVQAFDLEAGGKALAAYIVADQKIDISALVDFIQQQKPPYMVPAITMQIGMIPLNVNGKVDKKQLPKPQINTETEADNSATAAPLNRLEKEIIAMVGRVTDCREFPLTTPLSYVGLTSISSLKLSIDLFKRFGVNISSRGLAHGASVQTIEDVILDHLLNDASATPVDVPKVESTLQAPLSNAQLGVYYECLKDSLSTVYNIPYAIKFPDTVTPQQLQAAVAKVIALHPLMSVHFDNTVDPPVQISDSTQVLVTILDKSAEELKAGFVQPFNLTKGPLYRAVVSGSTLLLDVHHLIMDGSSLSIFLQQICACLEGKSIPSETCNFFQYSREEQTADTSEAEAFFKEQLSCVDDASSIPADLHGNESEGHPAEQSVLVNNSAIAEFARSRGITPAAVYLAAVEYIAARYGNTKDVCLCTVSSGRGDVRISDTVGMFVNTLVLVSHITDQTVGEYVDSVAANFRSTLDHENFPFAKISNTFGLHAELVFVYQLGVVDQFSVNGAPVEMMALGLNAPKFKITLLVEERGGKVKLVAQYNDALYSASMMARMLDSLRQVLENFVSSADSPVRKISIVSPAQLKELEGIRYGAVTPLPIRVFHQGIERWAVQTPDSIAIIATDKTLTYREFEASANRVANALLAKGLKRGDAMVVLLPRNSTTPVCILGIMKAGGAFIPCDPEYPTERIQLIAEDSGAPFVITTAELAPIYGKRGLVVDELVNWSDDKDPQQNVTPSDLAYLIYTSGSTGKPKGVVVSHSNITVQFNTSPHSVYHPMATQCERLCSVFTISFDAFIMEFGMTLFNGRTLVFSNEVESKDPTALTALMKHHDADYFGCTSSRMLQYMELPDFVDCLRKCKVILQGGEKFSDTLLKQLKNINNTCVIINGYGPTEVGIGCNIANLQNADKITVGKPMPNYTEWILDQDGNELPVGVTGELCAGGEGITQGYKNLPEMSAEKFITYGAMRAFKTGDYARWMTDGQVEVLGRTDNQVKLRGLRIELGEVESAISTVEGVKNMLVRISTIQGRDHLCAYYVADKEIPVDEMKKSIGHSLPVYMIPSAYLQMDSFPITPNGKIDFRHLPEPQLAQAGGDYVAPANPVEKYLANTFRTVLNLEKVGATDSFFDLGGTSLVVMRVVIALQEAGYSVSYADIFAHPTPRKLAVLIGGTGENEQADPDADIRNFDYSNIDSQLGLNTLSSFTQNPQPRPLGNVLLTGATGFLGIHVFQCLLEKYPDTTIHCLQRSSHGIAAEKRLQQMLFYYFEKNISAELGKRIFVYDGEVTAPINIDAKIDTVINCAAVVKHFVNGTLIEDVNVGGVSRCIDFCLEHKSRLIQVSTYSVAGSSVHGEPQIKAFNERMLYKGQRIHNQYIHSKIMGERLLLNAVATQGLDAKVMRVGNLSARSFDGEFQININNNTFMGRLKIFNMLGVLPYSSYASPVEFSPIDETAAAICLLAQTASTCTIFHPYNNHSQLLGDVLKRMETIGKEIRLVEDSEYFEVLNKAKSDKSKQEQLSAMLAYESKDSALTKPIAAENEFTQQVLLRLGFRWDMTSWNYIDKFLKQIDSLSFFEEE